MRPLRFYMPARGPMANNALKVGQANEYNARLGAFLFERKSACLEFGNHRAATFGHITDVHFHFYIER